MARNAIAQWNKLVQREMDRNGGDKRKAVIKVKSGHPALWQAMTATANRGKSSLHVLNYIEGRQKDDGLDTPADEDDDEDDDEESDTATPDNLPVKKTKKTEQRGGWRR